MNKIKNFAYAAAVFAFSGVGLQSCSVEEPFGSGEEGVLQMKLMINSDVTRAAMNEQELADNCVVYISNPKGLVFKNKGLSTLPEQLRLKQGSYVAEAWTGDSVSADFEKKFYRCYQPFQLTAGVNELQLTCKIANVVASVNSATIDDDLIKDFKVTVASSAGSLVFDADNYRTAKGYFMMPYKDGVRESELTVTVEGKNILGEPFSKVKTISDVKSAHEYVVNVSYNANESDPEGGGYIVVTIDERENLINDTVAIFAAPLIEGVDFDITKQIVGEAGKFTGERKIKVVAFHGIHNFTLQCHDMDNLHLPATEIDLKNCTPEVQAALNAAGISWDRTFEDVEGFDGVTRQLSYIYLSEAYLNSLPERADEYRITLTATDNSGADGTAGKTTVQTLRIAVGEDAVVVDDPIVIDDADLPTSPTNRLAVGAQQATLTATLVDESVTNPAFRYRKAGTEEWSTAPLNATRATGRKVSATLSGLTPGTRYEYQLVADDFTSESRYFNTESMFIIPNASLEEWSNYSANNKILLPGAGGERTFWDSGNHGSATMSVTLTQGSSDMFHSGSQSAKLRSQFVGVGSLGKFAAGNLFAGEYYKTNGTNGEIYFGREYNGSHPKALKVFVNYRPGTADAQGSKNGKLNKGDLDKGQIYVALTTEKVHIDTRYPDSMLWNTNADCVLAYGEKIFSENYGPDGQLQELLIPIDYKASANSREPLYLVIVCTASYYGDYFDGGEGSTMYVDDFELVY